MNESRKQLYLNLINKLLTCDEGEEPEILRANADLIDAELVLMMERVVSVLEERDAKQQAEWLQELANRLAGSLEMPLVSEREERGVYRQVRSLERRFGKGHLYFAYHAAFPLALTPDLCYQIWANFQRDIDGKLLNIPWIAVADLLLSGLCRPVGHELYEMDLAVRNLLLKELRKDFNFGEIRIEELSRFMLEYVKGKINSEDEDIRDFATVQRWTALAYVKPGEAAKELALTLREKVLEGNKAELVRLSSVLENLAEPLRGEYEPLLVYGRGMGRLARGDSEGASREFQGLGEVGDLEREKIVEELREDILFESGSFVVGESGEIEIDYLFDGTEYQGELAIFSLKNGDVFRDLARRLKWRRDYFNLIQLLLDCPLGQEGEILRRHQHLVDSVLVEMMRQVAASFVEVGEGKAAEFLVAVADTLAEASEKVQILDWEQELQEYALEAQRHPFRSRQRKKALDKLITEIVRSNLISYPSSYRFLEFYEDIRNEAIQKTALYLLVNIEKYNQERSSVITWFNYLLETRFFQEAFFDNFDIATFKELTNNDYLEDIENRENIALKLSEKLREYLEEDPEYLLRNLRHKVYKAVNFWNLVLRRMAGQKWRDISKDLGVRISTISSFYQRCLREISPQIRRYLES